MRGRSGGAMRTARTRYNVKSRGKDAGVEAVKRLHFVNARWNRLPGLLQLIHSKRKLSTDISETNERRYVQGLSND